MVHGDLLLVVFAQSLRRPLPPRQRLAAEERFIEFTVERDGKPNFVTGELPLRDERIHLRTVAPPIWKGKPVDQYDFDRLFFLGGANNNVTGQLDESSLCEWLVDLAHTNDAEDWGVRYLRSRNMLRFEARDARSARDYADIQETYHTSALQEIIGLFGVRCEPAGPPKYVRVPVMLMAKLPAKGSRLLMLAAEMIGTIGLLEMREQGQEILQPVDPDIWDAVRERLDEILVDELGHMMVLWSTCSWFEINALAWITKFFQFFVERAFGTEPAEHHDRLSNFSLADIPEEIVRKAFVPESYLQDV